MKPEVGDLVGSRASARSRRIIKSTIRLANSLGASRDQCSRGTLDEAQDCATRSFPTTTRHRYSRATRHAIRLMATGTARGA